MILVSQVASMFKQTLFYAGEGDELISTTTRKSSRERNINKENAKMYEKNKKETIAFTT